jgi:hypothetical protein
LQLLRVDSCNWVRCVYLRIGLGWMSSARYLRDYEDRCVKYNWTQGEGEIRGTNGISTERRKEKTIEDGGKRARRGSATGAPGA